MNFPQITQWLDAHVDEMIELQRQLTAHPALNPEAGGEGEWDKANMLENWLAEHGLGPAEHYDTPDERLEEDARPNFVVRIPGQTDGPVTWVMTHLDVVPPGEQAEDGTWTGWDSDPFVLCRKGDRLYGRGVEDNQQSMVASVFAARVLQELDIHPPRPVALLFVSAEETGSEYGLQRLLQDNPHLFADDDIILVPDGGNDEGTMIEVAEKSVLWLTFTIEGQQTHGSTPQLGCNAFRAGIHLALALDEGLAQNFGEDDELYHPPTSTFEPTRHLRNVPNVNTVPGEEVLSFDCRVLPRYDLDDVLEFVREKVGEIDEEFGTRTEFEIENRLDAPPPTPTDAPIIPMLEKAVREVYEVEAEPMGFGGSTVAAYFRKAGYPAVVWSRFTATAHQSNECCLIPNMLGDSKVMAHLYMQNGG